MPSTANRYVCIHGHFYQPARENPWTGEVPLASDAYPFYDWNARIESECYGPNAWSQIRDANGKVLEIFNNYEHISFNFGPTLMSWIERHHHRLHASLLQADRASQSKFSGHGSAMAQCYNHMIMPLANRRDKITQVKWGIADFTHRFGRVPRGMWLPETAVNLETLDVLAENGILFTILAPRQIASTRPLNHSEWTPTPNESVDTRHPYWVRLPSGRSIAVFAFNGPVAQDVAFGKILDDGARFARKLLSAFDSSRSSPQLAHIATDGETFGHHHKFGDMGLAFALRSIEKQAEARLTNYSEYLSLHPPTHEAQIVENSSWSCVHGIERWRDDCGCNIGAHLGWHQNWRKPLREMLDWLRDDLNPRFEQTIARSLADPWAARDSFIDVLLKPGGDSEQEFFARNKAKRMTASTRRTIIDLMRMQRHLMLMYSSCGWFFDDISGLEASMLLQHASRAIDYARKTLGVDPEPRCLELLRTAPSNLPEVSDGASVYQAATSPYRTSQ